MRDYMGYVLAVQEKRIGPKGDSGRNRQYRIADRLRKMRRPIESGDSEAQKA